MAGRYVVTLVLFLVVAITPSLLDRTPTARAEPRSEVPADALSAIEQGRYWRASRILRHHLSTLPDTSPSTMLLVARADAGWGDWNGVQQLLSGRDWLDSVSGGYGWKLLGQSFYEQGEYDRGGDALARYLEVADAAGDRERGLTEVRRAFALHEAGLPAQAVEAFDRAAPLLPRLEDWVALWAAQAVAETGDTAALGRRMAEVDTDLRREFGWRARTRVYRAASAPDRALEVAESAAAALESASDRAAAWQVAGDIRLERGDSAGARRAFTRAMEASPGSESAVTAARQMSTMSSLEADDHLRIGRVYLRHGNRERGGEGLERYLRMAQPSATTRAEVELELGRALFTAGQHDATAERMLRLAGTSPSERIGSEAMYLAARALYRDGQRERAIETLQRVTQEFDVQPAVVRAHFLIADLAHDEGELETARPHYRQAIDVGLDIGEVGVAVMRLGGIAYLAGDYAGAADIYQSYLDRYPEGRRAQQAAYWAGRALMELGQQDRARTFLRRTRAMDPLTYYGFRAAELLGAPAEPDRVEPSPSPPAELKAAVVAGMDRVDLLRELEREDAVGFEVNRLSEALGARDGGRYLVAEALNARGMTFAGIDLGWDIRSDEGGWNERLLRIIYPFPYRDIIVAEATEQGLDPYLVAGLIRQESMFDAEITSWAGAEGLMQIMPETGAGLARGAGIREFQVGMLHRPEINIHLGTRYFARMLDRFDGNVVAALASYNAGPHRVDDWTAFPEYGEDELFTERIPYDETRDYVKKVQQNARLYRFLYGRAQPENGATAPL